MAASGRVAAELVNLSRLITERISKLNPNRCVAVPMLTVKRFSQITNVRKVLEGMVTAEGAKTVEHSVIDHMAELNARMDRLDPGDHSTFLELNRMFHFVIYQASGQGDIIELIEALWMQVGPLLDLLLTTPDQANKSRFIHHGELIEALRHGDAASASAAIASDIGDAAQVILTQFKANENRSPAP